jgi:hypothetical protein
MMAKLKLIDSPRLYVPAETAGNLQDCLHSDFLRQTAERVIQDANWLVRREPLIEGDAPSYLESGRRLQGYLECLTCAWILTRKAKYRAAAMKHLSTLLNWNHISCEARANTPVKTEMPFCLTYGEQSQAIGLMYDHFRPDLTSEEQKVFFDVIDRFHLKEAVKCLDAPPWWANKAWSNWNGVCCGGMGILALSFYNDRPEAQPLIPFVEKSLAEYFSSYVENGGGCHEGTGYWNYGMNYAMRYVLSWENGTGKKHPALRIKEIAKSLHFPLDFTGVSFGDNDGWGPTAFFFLLAKRLGEHDAALRAATYLSIDNKTKADRKNQRVNNGDLLYAADAIPTDQEMDKLKAAHRRKKVPVARTYKGMDWAALADDEAFPSLRMSVRGGSAKVQGHGMVDLLSFRCRVNGELMITDQADTGYLTTTFGRRGTEIYPRSAAAKSTLFVEGLGPAADAECDKTEIVTSKGLTGVRIDATRVYLQRMPAKFIGRLALMVDNEYWLVIDRAVGKTRVNELAVESRFHTYADYRVGRSSVALTSGKQRMQMTFAALHGGVIQQSRGMPPLPKGEQTTIFRWMGKQRVQDGLHVTAMVPGSQKASLAVSKQAGGNYRIDVKRPGKRPRRVTLSSQLRLR